MYTYICLCKGSSWGQFKTEIQRQKEKSARCEFRRQLLEGNRHSLAWKNKKILISRLKLEKQTELKFELKHGLTRLICQFVLSLFFLFFWLMGYFQCSFHLCCVVQMCSGSDAEVTDIRNGWVTAALFSKCDIFNHRQSSQSTLLSHRDQTAPELPQE